jgi:hypothetical protein
VSPFTGIHDRLNLNIFWRVELADMDFSSGRGGVELPRTPGF